MTKHGRQCFNCLRELYHPYNPIKPIQHKLLLKKFTAFTEQFYPLIHIQREICILNSLTEIVEKNIYNIDWINIVYLEDSDTYNAKISVDGKRQSFYNI